MINCYKIKNTNFKYALSYKKYLIILFIFFIVLRLKLSYSTDTANLDEFLYFIFYGPKDLTNNFNETILWSLYQFYLIYLGGSYIYDQFKVLNVYTLFRIGKKSTWIRNIQLNLVFICIVYYLIGFICISFYFLISKQGLINFNLIYMLKIYFLLVLSSYLIITFLFMSFFITKNHSLSFIVIVLILYLSISFGSLFNIDIYIPFNHGILSKHVLFNLNFLQSYVYIIIFTIINILIINKLIIKNDSLDYFD